MKRVGIDLGTTFSVAGVIGPDGKPVLCPDSFDENCFLTPSLVHLDGSTAYVGEVVAQRLKEDPKLPVVQFPKVHMGKDISLFVDPRGGKWPAEAISALILRKLVQDAELYSKNQISGAVIALPAQFSSAQRQATLDAGTLAGLEAVSLVEEPVAAATYYGFSQSEKESTLFVFDLGGGTFDATILQASPRGLYVLSTEGAHNVGGKLYDEAIMDLIAEEFKRLYRVDLYDDPVSVVQLRRYAEQIKVQLSSPEVSSIRVTLLLSGKCFELFLTRDHFERRIARFVQESLDVCDRCLKGAALDWSNIDRILLTGGSTLVPMVQKAVIERAGGDPERIFRQEPHYAVGFGAALVASALSGEGGVNAPKLIQQIAAYDVGMRIWDKKLNRPGTKVLIKRNTPLPVTHTTTFFTTREDQTRLVFELVQSKGAEDPGTSLGSFIFGPIANPKKNYPIEVTLLYDLNGVVRVTARDPQTGQGMERILESDDQSGVSQQLRLQEMVRGVRVG